MAEKRGQNARATGGEWLQRNSVLRTQQDSRTDELTTVEDLPRFMLGWRVGTESHPYLRSDWPLIAAARRFHFLERCGP